MRALFTQTTTDTMACSLNFLIYISLPADHDGLAHRGEASYSNH